MIFVFHPQIQLPVAVFLAQCPQIGLQLSLLCQFCKSILPTDVRHDCGAWCVFQELGVMVAGTLRANHDPEEAGAGSNPSQLMGPLPFLETDHQTLQNFDLELQPSSCQARHLHHPDAPLGASGNLGSGQPCSIPSLLCEPWCGNPGGLSAAGGIRTRP